MHYIITFATVRSSYMSHWGDCKEIERLNTFWGTFSYNFENINKKKLMGFIIYVDNVQ